MDNLEELIKLNSVRTCFEYAQRGIATSGTYTIDPDGPMIGDAAIEVYCNFQDGTSELLHNHDNEQVEVDHCVGAMCYHLPLNYGSASMAQIQALIGLSESCHQEIKFDCFLAPIFVNGVPHAYWVNNKYQNETYFAGSNASLKTCQCGLTGDCRDNEDGQKCNCDAASFPVFLEDDGFITNDDSLPIMGIYYDSLEFESKHLMVTIGRLRCSGQRQFPGKTSSKSCRDLKMSGESRSGNIYSNQDFSHCYE